MKVVKIRPYCFHSCIIALLLAGLVFGAGSRAQAAPEAPVPPAVLPVSDLAGVIDPGSEARLTETLQAFERESGIQIAVLTLQSLDAYPPPAPIEELAARIFDAWGIGRAAHHDGILVLVVPPARAMRLHLGAGYDQGYDVIAQDVVNGAFLPDFRAGDYAAGIARGVDETIARIARRKAADLPAPEPPANGSSRLAPFAAAGIAAFILLRILRRRRAPGPAHARICPDCGRRRGHGVTRGEGTGEAASDGAGLCQTCGGRDDRDDRLPRDRPLTSGRGDPPEGGGGRSSGGGASGRF